MPALTEARYKALRHARECARIVLAKHPYVTGGSGRRGGDMSDPIDLRSESDRRISAHLALDLGGNLCQQLGGAAGVHERRWPEDEGQ